MICTLRTKWRVSCFSFSLRLSRNNKKEEKFRLKSGQFYSHCLTNVLPIPITIFLIAKRQVNYKFTWGFRIPVNAFIKFIKKLRGFFTTSKQKCRHFVAFRKLFTRTPFHSLKLCCCRKMTQSFVRRNNNNFHVQHFLGKRFFFICFDEPKNN